MHQHVNQLIYLELLKMSKIVAHCAAKLRIFELPPSQSPFKKNRLNIQIDKNFLPAGYSNGLKNALSIDAEENRTLFLEHFSQGGLP